MTKGVHVAIRIILQVQNPRWLALLSLLPLLSSSNREIYIHRADWPHVPLVFFTGPVNYVPGLLLCSIPYRYRPRHISSGTASFPLIGFTDQVRESDVALRSPKIWRKNLCTLYRGAIVVPSLPSSILRWLTTVCRGRSTINFSSYQVEAYQIGVYDSVPEAWSMIKSKTKIRGPRLSFIFYFIDGYGTHVKDIMIYPRGQKIVFQVAAGASYTSNQASSFDQITRRGMRITLVDFFQYVNIIGSINVYRRFRSHRVHNNGRPSCASILENGTTMLLIYIRISRVHDALTFREISGNGITRN